MAKEQSNMMFAVGSDAMQEYLDAQKNAREKFEERSNRLFDPTFLLWLKASWRPQRLVLLASH